MFAKRSSTELAPAHRAPVRTLDPSVSSPSPGSRGASSGSEVIATRAPRSEKPMLRCPCSFTVGLVLDHSQDPRLGSRPVGANALRRLPSAILDVCGRQEFSQPLGYRNRGRPGPGDEG